MTMPLFLILAFSIIGIFNAAYLSLHVFTKKPVACFFFPQEWCRKVQFSKHSRTFGIPNAFAGLALYGAILIFALLFASGALSFWYAAAFIAFGFVFSVYFMYLQAFTLKAYCTWCVLSFIDFVVLFVCALVILFW